MMQYSLRAKLIILSLTLLGISQTINPLPRQAIAQALPSLLSNSQLKQEKTNLSLYGGVRTRTPIVQWYLEEIAVPYQYISLDIKQQEHRQPEFLEINPMGKLPAIVNGEFKLWESGAILLYLADKYGQIPNSAEDRAIMTQWVMFANSTLANGLFLEDRREREIPRLLTPLNNLLQQQSFIVGSELSAADVAVGGYLYYAKILLSLDFIDYPAVDNYLNRLSKRPAFINTLGKR